MSQEIIEAVRDIEREKGIESGTLVAALEDALLAAYKKMPGSSRHATVEIDEQGDFRVRSEEHTSELQSQSNLVCRLLLEKKKNSKARQRNDKALKVAAVMPSGPTSYYS